MGIRDATEQAYKNGYKKGMEDAVKQGYARSTVPEKDQTTEDILKMLYIIHCENITIMSLLFYAYLPDDDDDTEKLIEAYKTIVEQLESYKPIKKESDPE